jgi:PAS domain S-box-containing protein
MHMADEDILRAGLRYRELFEEAPLSIWEEDFSGVKEYLDKLGETGITDFRDYFMQNPQALAECASRVRVLDVNKRTLELYGAGSKEEFFANLNEFLCEESYSFMMEQLLAIADGKGSLQGETVNRTLQGEKLDIYLKWIVAPDSRPAYSRVLVTIVDISERVRAEDKLRLAAEEWKDTFDATPDLVMMLDSALRITRVNRATREFFGLPEEQLVGNYCHRHMHGTEQPPAECPVHRIRESKRHEETEFYLPERDMWVQITIDPVLDEAGDIARIVHFCRDITGGKKAEGKLKESERLYRMLADNTQDLICMVDPRGTRLYVSPSYKNVLGYKPEELLGDHLLSVVHPDELEKVGRDLAEGMGRREPGDSRHRLRHKDGHYLWVDSHGTPLLDEEGNLIGGLAVSWNITEQLEAEEVLKRERQQLISIFESINQVIYVSDPATCEVLYVNQAMKDAFGKELIGGLCYREFQGLEEPCDFCTNGIILANQGEPYIWEYHNPLTDRDYLIVDRIITWPPDERDARFELAIDITERKQTEKALRDYNEQLKNFLAVAAHELRHPICLVQGYANTLVDFRQDMPQEMLNEVFDSIAIASHRLTNLVEELLEVSRIEKERFPIERCDVDPERILRQVVEEMRERGVENPFEVKTAEGVGSWSLDQDKFHELMVILVDNAAKYSPPDSPVEVGLEKTADGLSICVLDRGRGVSAEEREKIFQRFYQVEDPRHHSIPGLGLGLYIAREIVDGHGGSIGHEDRPGGGSVFRVILP